MVGHVVFEHAVDEQGELTSGRRHGGGLVCASDQPAVERPERVVAPNEGHGREAEDLGGSIRGRLRARPEQLPPPVLSEYRAAANLESPHVRL